ncbi:MAG: hypothetical protein OEZ13_10335 [Spirochaetia bacterium]|nr:hypothetical protein [Spirochaetia bacterium]
MIKNLFLLTVLTMTAFILSNCGGKEEVVSVQNNNQVPPPVLPTAELTIKPPEVTVKNDALFVVGGTNIVAYKYRVDTVGWSDEMPVSNPIYIENIANARTKIIYVIGKDNNDLWQSTETPTIYSWRVDKAYLEVDEMPNSIENLPEVNTLTFNYAVLNNGITAYKFNLNNTGWVGEFDITTPLEATVTEDGMYSLKIIGKDANNNWQSEATAEEYLLLVKTNAYTAVFDLTTMPKKITNQTSTDIIITGVDGYKYSIDGGPYSAEFLPATILQLTGLSEGEHTISVIGKDALGNWQSEASATTYTWSIDTSPPIFSGIMSAVSVNNTAIDVYWTPASDNITESSSIVYEIFIARTSGGQNFSSRGIASQPGALSYSFTTLLPNTTYYFVVRARDIAGNISINTVEKAATTKRSCPGGINIKGVCKYYEAYYAPQPFRIVNLPDGMGFAVSNPPHKSVWLYDNSGKAYRAIEVNYNPYGIAVNSAKELLISNRASQSVDVYSLEGSYKRSFGVGNITFANDISVFNGKIFIADSTSNMVRVYNEITETEMTAFGDTELKFPTCVEVNPALSEIAVCDFNNNTVRIYDFNYVLTANEYQAVGSTYASGVDFSFFGDPNGSPMGVTFTSIGGAYVLDSLFSVILVFDTTHTFTSYYGSYGTLTEQLKLANDVIFSDDGVRLLVTNAGNKRIEVFNIF